MQTGMLTTSSPLRGACLLASWSMPFGFLEHAFWSRGAMPFGLSDDATSLSKEYKLEAKDTAPPWLNGNTFCSGGNKVAFLPGSSPPP